MNTKQFTQDLLAQGYDEVTQVQRPSAATLDTHTHPFEARALILEGEIVIRTDDGERCYQAGDVFHLQAHEPHAETYGPVGVVYLVGRKRRDAA